VGGVKNRLGAWAALRFIGVRFANHTHGKLTTTGRILCMDLRRAGQLPLGGQVAPPPRELPTTNIVHGWEAFCTFHGEGVEG
jgi:hypothetical protein